MMSFTTELERTAGDLAALCRRSFGPCGEETLLFRPPDAPVVTGEGHAVLAAWKRGTEARDPLATFLLNAADGVHKQLGDASSEFILLVDAAVRHAAEGLRREQDARRDADRARLSREFSELKWELQRGMHKVSGLQLAVSVEANCDTMQPSEKFRETSANVLRSALTGVLGERAVDFVVELVLKWIFTAPSSTDNCSCRGNRMDKVLFQRVQQFLKCAPDAVIHMAAPSLYASYVVPREDFILKKSVVMSQPSGILDRCQDSMRFVCFTCPLSLSAGSNHVELATKKDEELFTAHDSAHLFISKFIRRLRDQHHVQLIVSTEALDESVVANCTRQDIACVQLAEPEDVEALCIIGGIFPLASVFDDIQGIMHVGVCTSGVSRVRFQQQACLRLRGVAAERSNQREDFRQNEHRHQEMVVPQLLIHAPTKGVYKQYYAAIVKSLRVLRSWWEPLEPASTNENGGQHSQRPSMIYTCRGGGATELAVAQWLQGGSSKLSGNILPRDGVMNALARQVLANALIESVSTLRSCLNITCLSAGDVKPTGNQRQVLLEAFSSLKLQGRQIFQGYTLNYSRVVQTLAGPIQIPELVIGDPEVYGLIHPWRRIDTLLFLVLQTLEQLFRIDRVVSKTNPAANPTNTAN